eukprot:4976389-Pyramimonas_sp.AAC.1
MPSAHVHPNGRAGMERGPSLICIPNFDHVWSVPQCKLYFHPHSTHHDMRYTMTCEEMLCTAELCYDSGLIKGS